MDGGGVAGEGVPDARAMKWSKLLANLVGNATSAILDLDPGEVYADPRGYAIERRQLHEAVAVMRAMDLRPVALPGAHVSLLLRGLALPETLGRPIVSRAIAGARGGKSPSLRLHVRGGGSGPTEARWLNGAVAAAGARLGVPTPVNAFLAALTDEVAATPDARHGSRGGPTGWPTLLAGRRPARNGPGRAYTRPPVDTFDLVQALLIVAAAFVIGGIPWSIIVARLARRPDPRTIGSGRTGGANAMRAMGPQLALISGILDLLKGTAAVLLARWLGAGEGVQVVAALAAIIGHSRSVFLGLGGGRGVAPAFGGLLAFAPLIAMFIIPLFMRDHRHHALLVGGLARRVGARGDPARVGHRDVRLEPVALPVCRGRHAARVAVPHRQHPAAARGHGTQDRDTGGPCPGTGRTAGSGGPIGRPGPSGPSQPA